MSRPITHTNSNDIREFINDMYLQGCLKERCMAWGSWIVIEGSIGETVEGCRLIQGEK